MTTALMAALLLVSSLFPIGFPENSTTQSSLPDNRQEAERLWELAIAAKGGRERLYSVNNLQISIREKVWYKWRRVPFIEEDLYVFPDKYWEWNDQKETIFGFSLRTYNRDRDIYFWYLDHGKGGHLGRHKVIDDLYGDGGRIHLYDVQLRYFMETKWVKPVPISVQKARRNFKRVDIVQTIVKGYPTRDGTNEKRIAFVLDHKTHLPLRLIYYTAGREYTGEVPLSDYVNVAGIQMPSKVYDLRTSYQINVDYDEEIFTREPNVAAGIKQWSKK